MIGNDGLTSAVLRELERAVVAHELVKIRVFGDDREQREQFFDEICEKLGCAPVQHIGKVLVVWRKNEEKAKAAKAAAARTAQKPKPPRQTKRQEESSQATGKRKVAAATTRRRVVRKV
jgi:RNA-binding protein